MFKLFCYALHTHYTILRFLLHSYFHHLPMIIFYFSNKLCTYKLVHFACALHLINFSSEQIFCFDRVVRLSVESGQLDHVCRSANNFASVFGNYEKALVQGRYVCQCDDRCDSCSEWVVFLRLPTDSEQKATGMSHDELLSLSRMNKFIYIAAYLIRKEHFYLSVEQLVSFISKQGCSCAINFDDLILSMVFSGADHDYRHAAASPILYLYFTDKLIFSLKFLNYLARPFFVVFNRLKIMYIVVDNALVFALFSYFGKTNLHGFFGLNPH